LDAGGNPTGDPIVIAQLYASSSSVDFSVAWNGSVFVVGYAMFSGLHGEVVSVAADDHVTTLGEFSHEQYGSSALIAVAGGNRGALLVWNTDQLNGAFIGTGATPTIGAAQLMAASSAAQKEPSIAWCGDAYRAVWNEQSDRGRIVFGRVSARGVPVDVQGRYVSDSPGFQVMPRIACNASNSLVVWMELLSDVWTTRAALLDSDGTSHPPIDLGPTYSPAVVWNGSEYLVASQSADTHEVMLRRIAQDGQPIDVIPKILRSATDSFGDSSPSIAWNGSEYLIGWVSVNGVFDSLPTRHGIYAVRVTRELTSVGSVHELSPPRSVASNADSASPLAIAGDHEWLVAWKEWPDYARWLDKAAYFARLSPALDPISTGVLNRNAPPSDGTFNGGAYQFVYGLAAIAHGGSVPIVIRGRDTEEFLPRLYVSIESERMRPARR
jgi:hypothetical protein